MGTQKGFFIIFPGMFYTKTKWDSLLVLQKQKSLQEIQVCFPKDIEYWVICTYSCKFIFYRTTVIRSESLLYLENGIRKKRLHVALLTLPYPSPSQKHIPNFILSHLYASKVMMYEFLHTLTFVSYVYLGTR